MIDVTDMPNLEFDTWEEASTAMRGWLQATNQRAAFGVVVRIRQNYVLMDFYRDGAPAIGADNA